MQIMGLRHKTDNLTRCDLCHTPSHWSYKINLGGLPYQFCGAQHAQKAIDNYEEKMKKGITPDNPKPLVEETQDEPAE